MLDRAKHVAKGKVQRHVFLVPQKFRMQEMASKHSKFSGGGVHPPGHPKRLTHCTQSSAGYACAQKVSLQSVLKLGSTAPWEAHAS